jgi:hypothetical protein
LISTPKAHRKVNEAVVRDVNIVERDPLDAAAADSAFGGVDGVLFVDDERSAPSSA